MKIVILKDASAVAKYSAAIFIKQIQNKADCVLGFATGSTPVDMYNELINAYKNRQVSFDQVSSFNLDEYLGLSGDHQQSYRFFMNDKLFDHIDIDLAKTTVPPGDSKNPIDACAHFERKIIECGGIDIQLLGLGRNGHIGFNEPSSSLSSRTRIKTLKQQTINDNARFFKDETFQPHLAITMGIGTILEARKIVLLATGKNKAQAIADTIQGPITAQCPASALQLHANTVIVIDELAASKLTNIDFFKHIERENQKLEKSLGL
ncbi:MAG: glucosamine-6-phosphate deaminase [Saccharospirillaceae bacterium]|nr:glucosamine-6-phosphate deaminase [Pseudomonadales bacterium]NRB80713.1 glucosamine-6-phosphate deaminase [Saccharospirillaceae bacterium]